MPLFALYLVKLSISLGLAWLFYQAFLRRLTFYDWNRWYLLGYSLLSFLIPLIDLHAMMDSDRRAQPAVIRYIPVIGNFTPFAQLTPASGQHASTGLSAWALCFILLAVGSTFFSVKLLIRWLALRTIRNQATLISEAADKVRVYQVDGPIVPFSFGNAVYANQRLHAEKEWEEIILHEFVHIRQRHTVDILVAELLCAFNWFNPFAWLIRFSIRQNLEFIADRKVLENGVDRKNYQYHLLKVIGQPRYRLANNFNFSSLKKRIAMMNKIQSARHQLIKFLFMLPLLAVLLVAFRGQYKKLFDRDPGHAYWNIAGIIVDYNTYKPIPDVSLVDKQTGVSTMTDIHGFFRVQVPVLHDSTWVHLYMSRRDYDTGIIHIFSVKLTRPQGIIEISFMHESNTEYKHGAFMGYQNNPRPPLEPTYEDALKALQEVRHDNEEMDIYLEMQKAHPEPGKPEHAKPAPVIPAPLEPESGIKEHIRLDTVPQNTDASKDGPARPQPMLHMLTLRPDTLHLEPVWVVDGKVANDGVKNLNPNQIYAIAVLKSNTDSLVRIYGERAKNGVVLITTRQHAPTPDDILNHRARVVTSHSTFAGPVHISWTGDRPIPGLIIGSDKNSKQVYLVDGKVVTDGTDLSNVLHLEDMAGVETSREPGLVRRFGGHDGQMVTNVITLPNKNNPASYILTYEFDNSMK